MMRVLYLSHVDWAWIKQRPQFLAEGLQDLGVVVDVRYLPAWRRGVRSGSCLSGARRLPHLPPVSDVVRWRLNPALRRGWLRATARDPDYVWLTHPAMILSVPRSWANRVVYDAMDVVTAFGPPEPRLVAVERLALCSAKVVIASSDGVRRHLESYGVGPGAEVVRNALDASKAWPVVTGVETKRLGPVTYCGTVSEWFDLDAVAHLRQSHPELAVRVIGPVEKDLRPAFERLGIELLGPVRHEDLLDLLCEASVLIMPFKVTPLVAAVDPVKLYEYVATGIPVVSVWYEELAQFLPFVNFYRASADFTATVVKASQQAVDGGSSRLIFCLENSWKTRAAQVLSQLAPRG